MVPVVYIAAALATGGFAWEALRASGERVAGRAYAALGAVTSLSFAGFVLYLWGETWAWYVFAVAGATAPWLLQRLLDRLIEDKPAPSLVTTPRLGVLSLAAISSFLVIRRLHGGPASAAPETVILGALTMAAFGLSVHRLWLAERRSRHLFEKVRLRALLASFSASLVFLGLEMLLRPYTRGEVLAGGGALANAAALQGGVPPFGALFFAIFLYFLYRVVVHRVLDLREILSRLVTVSAAAGLLVVAEELVASSVGGGTSTWAHRSFQLFLVSWCFLFAYQPLRDALDRWAGEWFNRPGRRLDLTLAEVDQAMAKVVSLEGMDRALLAPLQASGRAPLASLYLWDQEQGLYQLAFQRGTAARPLMQTIGARPFTDGFEEGTAAYSRDDLHRLVLWKAPGHEEAAARLRAMDAMGSDLALPIRSGDLVLGWLNLRASDAAGGFSRDEVRRLAAAVDRAAVVLENIASVEQMEEQRRLAALGNMAAGLAHEIRNPLSGIKGAAQYLQEGADPEQLREMLSVIVDEANRLNAVVTQFLDYARPLKLHVEPTAVEPLVRRIIELVRVEGLPPDVAIEADLEDDLPHVPVDRDKLTAVLLNLVQNAVQAVGNSGTVTVRARTTRLGGPTLRGPAAMAISVVDDGPGIEPEDMDNLFVPFFTTKPSGTGLGLAISRRLVQEHGGDIAVRTRPGHGAAFTVRLPLDTEGGDQPLRAASSPR